MTDVTVKANASSNTWTPVSDAAKAAWPALWPYHSGGVNRSEVINEASAQVYDWRAIEARGLKIEWVD